MSSKEPPLSPRAEQLKALGNARFKAAEYSKAFILYTAAIVEESNSPALFSNRSATAIKLRHPDQAISDAQRAIQLDPDWDKAHGRLAAAYEEHKQYPSASAAYADAANVASNPKAKVDYESLSKQIARKAPPGPDAKPYVVGNPRMDNDPFDKFVMLIGEGRKFRLDSAAVRHVLSSAEVVNAWRGMQDPMIKLPSGGPFGLPAAMLNINAVYDLAVAMLVDPTNSFAYEPHRTWPNPVDLLTNQINIEQRSNRLPPLDLSPEATIGHFESIRQQHGWDDLGMMMAGPRNQLACLICISVTQGIMKEMVTREFNAAAEHYARAVAIIEQGRAKWPGQAGDKTAGRCLTASFLRVVKCRLLASIVYREMARGPQPLTESMIDIERLSNEILQSCDQEPEDSSLSPTGDPWDVTWWMGSYAFMRAEAHLALAVVHENRAKINTTSIEGVSYLDPIEARLALESFVRAAAWYPKDEKRRSQSIWHGIMIAMHLGGLTFETLDLMIAAAQASEADHDRFWDSQRRIEEPFGAIALASRKRFVEVAEKKGLDLSRVMVEPQTVTMRTWTFDIRDIGTELPSNVLDTKQSLVSVYEQAVQAVQRELAKGPPMGGE